MYDPQNMNPQYLENLATAYWYSETLFTAVENEIFTRLEPDGKTIADLADAMQYDPKSVHRFIHALSAMGLVFESNGHCSNTKLSRKYLVRGAPNYQGESILWRKYLVDNWKNLDRSLQTGGRVSFPPADESEEAVQERFRRYCRAMDCIVKNKIGQVVSLFSGFELRGNILDVGSGLGAFSVGFLQRFPDCRATLLDMSHVLEYAKETHAGHSYAHRIEYRAMDILKSWELPQRSYGLIILSNIVHAFAEPESAHVLSEAASRLKDDGVIVIHDFFTEHAPEKAALSDLNMLVNTYNGKIFSAAWVKRQLQSAGLSVTELIPLESDTALLAASVHPSRLAALCIDKLHQLSKKIQALGFQAVIPIDIASIHVPQWVTFKCRFGCDGFGRAQCPPNCIPPEKTRTLLKDYQKCLLLQGVPPTADFQKMTLRAEGIAFKSGYYRAFSLWAGPCSICKNCGGYGNCTHPKNARPSMEASGIDVFETVRRAGIPIRTLPENDDYVKYFSLLLLE